MFDDVCPAVAVCVGSGRRALLCIVREIRDLPTSSLGAAPSYLLRYSKFAFELSSLDMSS